MFMPVEYDQAVGAICGGIDAPILFLLPILQLYLPLYVLGFNVLLCSM